MVSFLFTGVLLVYDVTDRESFTHLDTWRQEAEAYADSNVKIIVLGNKLDLNHARQVSTEEAVNYCNSHGYSHFEVSAATGAGLEDAFAYMASRMLFIKF